MKYYITNSKLKLIMDELGEEYKELLIEKLLSDYQTSDIEALPISELLKLDVSIKEKLIQNKRLEKRKRIYSMFASIGIMYSLLGIFLLFFQEFKYSFSNEPINMLALIMIMLGLFILMYSLFAKNLFLYKKTYSSSKDSSMYNYEIVSLWKELEGLMVQLSPENHIASPSQLTDYLVNNDIISNDDEDTIQALLKLRNQIVHNIQPATSTSFEEITLIIKKIRVIISKLNTFI